MFWPSTDKDKAEPRAEARQYFGKGSWRVWGVGWGWGEGAVCKTREEAVHNLHDVYKNKEKSEG